LPHVDVHEDSTTAYTVTASQVGTSVFQPGVTPGADPTVALGDSDAPRQIAMGLVGILIVTPTGCTDATNNACAFDTTPYADEAVIATTTLDAAFAAAVTGGTPFDMSYFGQSRDSHDQPRRVYHLINGRAFPDTQVIDAKAGDAVLLRYVNASVTDKSLGLLGLREVLLGRNADPYPDPQTFIAPLIGPGETADVAVTIPADAGAGQKYSLMDQGRQMNHGSDAGFGGALTFIVVWKGTPTAPTVTGLTFDPATNTVSGTANPSAAAFPVKTVEWSTNNFTSVAGTVTGAAITTFAAHVPVTGTTTVAFRATDSNNLLSPVVPLTITPGSPTLTGLSYDLATGHLTGTATPWDPLIPVTKVEWSTDAFASVAGTLAAPPAISALDLPVGLTAPATISVKATDAGGHSVSVDVAVNPAAPSATAAIDTTTNVGNIIGTGTATAGLKLVAAEYFVGADPGVGHGLPLTVSPNTGAATVAANPAVTFASGTVVSLRVQDSFGQWSAVATVTA
jgi:hypothetical protein